MLMREFTAFAIQIVVVSFLSAAAEYVLPSGRMKGAAKTAIGLLYIASVVSKMIGIIDRMGV